MKLNILKMCHTLSVCSALRVSLKSPDFWPMAWLSISHLYRYCIGETHLSHCRLSLSSMSSNGGLEGCVIGFTWSAESQKFVCTHNGQGHCSPSVGEWTEGPILPWQQEQEQEHAQCFKSMFLIYQSTWGMMAVLSCWLTALKPQKRRKANTIPAMKSAQVK